MSSNLRFLDHTLITDALLTSSTAPETDYAAWSGATTYAATQRVILTSTHRIYESAQAGNLNHNPATDDGTWWIDVGPTNRWKMFDQTVGTVTSITTPLTVVLQPGIINGLAMLDVSATDVEVEMTDGVAGPVVYSKTTDMSDEAILVDWWDYFFEPIVPKTTLILDDLPPYSTGVLTVTINATTTAACGTLAVGDFITLGKTRYGASIGIIDYSRKETDDFGVTSVIERSYAKKLDLDFTLNNLKVDYVALKLAGIRATPVVWVASSQYSSMIVYGFYKDWGVSINYPKHSEASLSIEGLV